MNHATSRPISAIPIATLVAILISASFAHAQAPNLLTVAESSNYEKTATYEESMELCRQLAKSCSSIRLDTVGHTMKARNIPLLVIANPPVADAEAARQAAKNSDKLTVLLVGNIHAGEVCGKEALLRLAREFAEGRHQYLLSELIVLVAPIYNADGNQPFGPDNRPNQAGPAGGVGQRANAQGLDLNRDFVKLEAPETRGLVQVMTDWDPALVIDTHTTNGSYHRYTITYDGPRHPATPQPIIEFMRDRFLPDVGRRLEAETGYRSFYYGNFADNHRKWETYPAWPRYGVPYVGVRGRLSILSEAYAYAPYRDRVLATRHFVEQCLRLAVERKSEIETLLKEQDAAWSSSDEDQEVASVAVQSEPRSLTRTFDVLGFADDDRKKPATGEKPQFPTTTKTYSLSYLGDWAASSTVKRPYAYLIPPDQDRVLKTLARHGIQLEVLREDRQLNVERWQPTGWSVAAEPFQKHRLVGDVQTSTNSTDEMIAAGTVVARTDQPLGRLLMLLLEPTSEDGLLTWNFFDEYLTKDRALPLPIGRVNESTSLFTSKRSSQNVKRLNKRPVNYESVYGDNKINLRGSPMGRVHWSPADGADPVDRTYRTYRDGKWQSVNATTGEAEPWFDREQLIDVLQTLPQVERKHAKALTGSGLLSNAEHVFHEPTQTRLMTHRGDLYATRLDGTRAGRLTDSPGQEELASLSPDGQSFAFVRDFNLFAGRLTDSGNATVRQLTFDGHSTLRNGKADWVYFEEIYGRDWRSYHWSPDSSRLAFLQFDDTSIADFTVVDHMPHRLNVERERYPKSGDPIPRVKLGVVATDGGGVQWISLDEYSINDRIVTRYGWLPDSRRLYVMVQNRAQSWLDLLIVDTKAAEGSAGKVRRLFRDKTKAWVPDPGDPHFLSDDTFLIRSDRDGWRHLYRYRTDGSLIGQVTTGEWEVRSVKRVIEDDPGETTKEVESDRDETDGQSEAAEKAPEAAGWVYLTGTRDSHLGENLYRVRLDGSSLTRLTPNEGGHRVNVAPDGTLFVDRFSSIQRPDRVVLRSAASANDDDEFFERVLDTNPIAELEHVQRGRMSLHEIETPDGFKLPALLIYPPDFQKDQQYPVWIKTYAGPHASTVRDDWRGGRLGEHLLANMGMIVVQCDPRSASARGPQSAWACYRQLGVSELEDLETIADWLAAQPFIDGDRIGLGGFSYGGFMAAYALTHSTKFAAGFSGAPVTDWRNYDAIYTERYMDTPQENPEGYKTSSVVAAAKDLHGKLLLVHGAKDDNVHVQNSLQFAERLQQAGKDFEMMIYPTARHGIRSEHFRKLRLDFIHRSLGLP